MAINPDVRDSVAQYIISELEAIAHKTEIPKPTCGIPSGLRLRSIPSPNRLVPIITSLVQNLIKIAADTNHPSCIHVQDWKQIQKKISECLRLSTTTFQQIRTKNKLDKEILQHLGQDPSKILEYFDDMTAQNLSSIELRALEAALRAMAEEHNAFTWLHLYATCFHLSLKCTEQLCIGGVSIIWDQKIQSFILDWTNIRFETAEAVMFAARITRAASCHIQDKELQDFVKDGATIYQAESKEVIRLGLLFDLAHLFFTAQETLHSLIMSKFVNLCVNPLCQTHDFYPQHDHATTHYRSAINAIKEVGIFEIVMGSNLCIEQRLKASSDCMNTIAKSAGDFSLQMPKWAPSYDSCYKLYHQALQHNEGYQPDTSVRLFGSSLPVPSQFAQCMPSFCTSEELDSRLMPLCANINWCLDLASKNLEDKWSQCIGLYTDNTHAQESILYFLIHKKLQESQKQAKNVVVNSQKPVATSSYATKDLRQNQQYPIVKKQHSQKPRKTEQKMKNLSTKALPKSLERAAEIKTECTSKAATKTKHIQQQHALVPQTEECLSKAPSITELAQKLEEHTITPSIHNAPQPAPLPGSQSSGYPQNYFFTKIACSTINEIEKIFDIPHTNMQYHVQRRFWELADKEDEGEEIDETLVRHTYPLCIAGFVRKYCTRIERPSSARSTPDSGYSCIGTIEEYGKGKKPVLGRFTEGFLGSSVHGNIGDLFHHCFIETSPIQCIRLWGTNDLSYLPPNFDEAIDDKKTSKKKNRYNTEEPTIRYLIERVSPHSLLIDDTIKKMRYILTLPCRLQEVRLR